jgi:class 3 adenylate cyclase
MGRLPSGTVTFAFTDVADSVRMWQTDPDGSRDFFRRLDQLVADACARHSGAVVKGRCEGDSHFLAFERATDAVAAVIDVQLELADDRLWPSPVSQMRAALHTGEADERDDDYFGPPVNRCARLREVAHGGQTLISETTYEVVRTSLPGGAELKSLGRHRLRSLGRAEEVFQLSHHSLRSEFPALLSLDARPNNLPIQLTSFVGRGREIVDLSRLLSESRLVTVCGVGGCGKTRLALQSAAELLDGFPDGVWLVPLSAVDNPGRIPEAAATELGLGESHGMSLTETICEHLVDSTTLLVIDNCEHLVDACADFIECVLTHCPGVRALATSREPLRSSGEAILRLKPLSLPVAGAPLIPQELLRSEAVRLFAERAVLRKGSFAVNERNSEQVALICSRLDGLPLAIELAASRLDVLSVAELAGRIEQRIPLHTVGARTAEDRHKTLQAMADWGYALLSPAEQEVFERLAVFSGSFALAAAESVAAAGSINIGDVDDSVLGLVRSQ